MIGLLEHLHRQVLCFVDDQHRAAMDRHQRKEELVQRADQLVLACGGNPAGPDALSRDDSEVEQHFAQQFLDREERIENQGGEDAGVELLEKGAAAGRFACADVTGKDDEPFLAADGLLQKRDGFFVRFAAIQESRIRRQRERRLYKAVILLVHRRITGLRGDRGCHAAGNITDEPL